MEKYHLVSEDETLDPVEHMDYKRERYFRHNSNNKLTIGLLAALCLSVSYSAVITTLYRAQEPDIGRSPFSGLGYDTPTHYRAHTDYWGENETLSHQLWDSIDTSPMGIAVTDEWAEAHGLPPAGRFPWDDNRGTYYVKAFHQLHCLKLMRQLVVDLRTGAESVIAWEHYQHCLDALRQDIMCRADDTPMYGRVGAHLGDGQVVMCRDWNKLIAWTQETAQNACYRSLDDYKTVKHSLERHAFCPEGSPYYEVSRAYFEKWGHVDAFEE